MCLLYRARGGQSVFEMGVFAYKSTRRGNVAFIPQITITNDLLRFLLREKLHFSLTETATMVWWKYFNNIQVIWKGLLIDHD